MTPTQHYECSLEQADGAFHLEHNANTGDTSDLFAGAGAPRLRRSTTTPNSELVGRHAIRARRSTSVSAPGADDDVDRAGAGWW